MSTLNTSPLFHSTVERPTFLLRLDLPEALERAVDDAQRTICDWLKVDLPRTLLALGHPEAAVRPRFFIQGSASHRTLNGPAWPGQQVDRDVGVYLPLSGLKTTGTPSQASSLFFRAMELSLGRLIGDRPWQLDYSKATCVRVVVHRLAHIDLPLYLAPDEEFVKISKAVRNDSVDVQAFEEELFERADLWELVDESKVHLAHRTENWKKSDARPVKRWFEAAVTEFGEQLRRIVRYTKALRDFLWPAGDGPSSLLLTAAVVKVFVQRERRDDLAFSDVLTALPDRLRAGVMHPVDGEESLTKKLGDEGLEAAVARFERVADEVRCALTGECARTACSVLVAQLGSRFPDDATRVQRVGSTAAAAMPHDEWKARVSVASARLGPAVAPKLWGGRR